MDTQIAVLIGVVIVGLVAAVLGLAAVVLATSRERAKLEVALVHALISRSPRDFGIMQKGAAQDWVPNEPKVPVQKSMFDADDLRDLRAMGVDPADIPGVPEGL